MRSKRERRLIEVLESRLFLSGAVQPIVTNDSGAVPFVQSLGMLSPTYKVLMGSGTLKPLQTAGPTGFTPTEIRTAYGLNQVTFGSVAGDGTGQTIAIIDAYNDPNIQGDLRAFDAAFGLPNPTLTVVGQNGSATLPGVDPAGKGNSNFEGEEALDVEWAHAIAPGAKLLLVEAQDASPGNLFAAINMARARAGVSVVSMSFGGNETSNEASFDSSFTTPAGHNGVTFVASTGDSGAPGGYPAYSPNVVATGGTSLSINSLGNYQSETAWSGSGGGVSTFETQPSYQKGIVRQSTTRRTIPDVAFDADPSTGVAVFDSYNNGTARPWEVLGGTSVAAPAWSGIFAIVNQGRVAAGKGTLDSRTNTLPLLYSVPAADFHDITTGSNGFAASAGYDLVTGRGSPQANLLIPFMVGGVSPPPNNPTPVSIASLSADATTVAEGTPVTITANGVVDSGPGVAVTFYEESNGVAGLQTGANGDSAFTPVTDGSNAITLDTSNSPGTFTIYAQVTDSSGAASADGTAAPSITITVTAATVNAGPNIASISATPNPVVTGNTITLAANGISDPDTSVRRVFFYQETNGIPGLQTGFNGDFSFRPVSAASDFSLLLDTTGVTGSLTFYALAVDNFGDVSAVGTAAPATMVNIINDVVPAAPSHLAAAPAGPTQINLRFAENDTVQEGFTIERATDPHFLHFVQLFTINRPNLFTYSDTGLSPNTQYYYRVQAFDAAGDSTFSNVASALTPPPATHLVILQGPTAVTAGHLERPVVVAVENVKGQVVATDSSAVTIGLSDGPTGAVIGGTLTVNAVKGVARFTDLTFTKSGTYNLRATDAPLAPARTAAFAVIPDLASAQFDFTRTPATIVVGRTLSPLVVEVRDRFGNLVTNSAATLSVAAISASGVVHGTTSVPARGGVATFNDLSFNRAGTYTVVVASNGFPTHPRATFGETILPGGVFIPAPPVARSYLSGKTITLATQMRSNTPVPFTGVATIVDQEGTVVARAAVATDGNVQFTLKRIAIGTNIWTVQYAGDENHSAGVSPVFDVVVLAVPTLKPAQVV